MSFFLEVVQSAFSPMVLFYMFAGVAAGICIGAGTDRNNGCSTSSSAYLWYGCYIRYLNVAWDLCRRDLRWIYLCDPPSYAWYTGIRGHSY